jgi:predicted dehydrogenase
MKRVRMGIIGCGTISAAYLRTLSRYPDVTVTALADLDGSRSAERAHEFGVPLVLGPDELLASADVDFVVNLTVPLAHAEISAAALEHGKGVYSEKPLATDASEAHALVALARERGLPLGCAPDTFLGRGLQTTLRALGDDAIGRPFAATAHVVGSGPERWHASPAFFYAPGAGPLLDMGPYYVTALVAAFGPVASVVADGVRARAERTVASGPLAGSRVPVEVDTHIATLLRFASGATATLLASFDVAASELPRLEFYGEEGSLAAPDPNTFGGPVRVRRLGEQAWRELPLLPGHEGQARGVGAIELIRAVAAGRPARASGALAAHVLEVLDAATRSAVSGERVEVTSRPLVPSPLEPGELVVEELV